MRRAIVLMLDSLGIGASADASRFGDAGADTFGHIAESCADGAIGIDGRVRGALKIPQLCTLGLAHAAAESRGAWPMGLPRVNPKGAWGSCGGDQCRQGYAPAATGRWQVYRC